MSFFGKADRTGPILCTTSKDAFLSSQALYSTAKLNHLLLYTWLSTLLLDHRVHKILEHQGCLPSSHHLLRNLHAKAGKCLQGKCQKVKVTSLVKVAYCFLKWQYNQHLKIKCVKTHRGLQKTSRQIRLIDLHSLIGPFPLHGQIFRSCKLAQSLQSKSPSVPVIGISGWRKPVKPEQFYQIVIVEYYM